MLINAHLSNLLNLTPVRNPTDIVGLRNLYDRVETQIRSLESLGIKGESYSNLLTPILLKQIPSELILEFNRSQNDEGEFRNREAEVSDEENIDNDIMSELEAGISYQNKRYKVKFPWKPNMKTLLENNEEIARKRFLKLRSRFKNDSSLFEDYKLVVNNYLSEKIVERVPFEEENLKHNIFYLPHRAVIRTDKTTSKLRIVFDASSHAKAQLSLNDCLHTGLNFIPNLFFLLIKFRVNPIAFAADIKMAFLMIEIDESERDITRFFWDENPGIDLENKRLDIFRMTRVLFGVKSSPFLLAATIKHHLKNMGIFFLILLTILTSHCMLRIFCVEMSVSKQP
ncbi:reverse transcriptase domain-containing protein [Trichonephila clavipes]|nr:reverse transcriptase domain-containing protein [Trichonephila clavipes]